MSAFEPIRSGHRNGAHRPPLPALEHVAGRMARKYPPDWLETYGGHIYGSMLAGCILVYLAIACFNDAWWPLLIPVLVPPTLAYIPDILFARAPGNPRWAHPRASVDAYEMELVHQAMYAVARPHRDAVMQHYPARTGARVYAVLQILRDICPP